MLYIECLMAREYRLKYIWVPSILEIFQLHRAGPTSGTVSVTKGTLHRLFFPPEDLQNTNFGKVSIDLFSYQREPILVASALVSLQQHQY